jgi:hypothetical protein
MMRREKFAIAIIYVPIKRRATLKPETVKEIAQSILEVGQQAPSSWCGAMVIASSSYTVCIASKRGAKADIQLLPRIRVIGRNTAASCWQCCSSACDTI